VANLWGVNEAQVSRYINHGEPELTLGRTHSLANMLGIPMDELYDLQRRSNLEGQSHPMQYCWCTHNAQPAPCPCRQDAAREGGTWQ
jgi:plasmid maintenance system antidote protein VapI